jgi:hypothetical protein
MGPACCHAGKPGLRIHGLMGERNTQGELVFSSVAQGG